MRIETVHRSGPISKRATSHRTGPPLRRSSLPATSVTRTSPDLRAAPRSARSPYGPRLRRRGVRGRGRRHRTAVRGECGGQTGPLCRAHGAQGECTPHGELKRPRFIAIKHAQKVFFLSGYSDWRIHGHIFRF